MNTKYHPVMSETKGEIIPLLSMMLLFILVYSISLLVIQPFEAAGVKAFENPENPLNIVYFILLLLIITLLILILAKYWKKKFIYLFILASVGITSIYVVDPLLFFIVGEPLSFILSSIIAAIIVASLVLYPEWYVLDICGAIVASGSIAIFGISLSIPLVILLLTILAIYDFISVYKTKHMIALADTVLDMKVPILFVIPKQFPYSFRKKDVHIKDRKKRDAFFMGVGDVVIPGILIASCYRFVGKIPLCMSTMMGILIGFAILMVFVIKGKPQAGLPFLNGGAIVSYIVSSYLLYGSILGFTI